MLLRAAVLTERTRDLACTDIRCAVLTECMLLCVTERTLAYAVCCYALCASGLVYAAMHCAVLT